MMIAPLILGKPTSAGPATRGNGMPGLNRGVFGERPQRAEKSGGGSVPEAHRDEIENTGSHRAVPPFGFHGDGVVALNNCSAFAGDVKTAAADLPRLPSQMARQGLAVIWTG